MHLTGEIAAGKQRVAQYPTLPAIAKAVWELARTPQSLVSCIELAVFFVERERDWDVAPPVELASRKIKEFKEVSTYAWLAGGVRATLVCACRKLSVSLAPTLFPPFVDDSLSFAPRFLSPPSNNFIVHPVILHFEDQPFLNVRVIDSIHSLLRVQPYPTSNNLEVITFSHAQPRYDTQF